MTNDYDTQLARQISFLQRSCIAYDNGDQDEALRIAVALRVLLHDTPRSTSLLTLMTKKTKIRLLSTMRVEQPKAAPGRHIIKFISIPVMLTLDGVKPPLGKSSYNDLLPVDAWWNQVVMVQGQQFSRKDIVLGGANQDGGAHVDPTPNAKTQELRSGIGTFTRRTSSGEEQETNLTNHHFPLLRQFAYEFLNSPDILLL